MKSPGAEVHGDLAGEALAVGRGVARPDHGDHAFAQQMSMADQGEQRRRVGDGGEMLGIIRLAGGDKPRTNVRAG